MKATLTPLDIEETFQNALHEGWIREEDTTVIFHDLTFLAEKVNLLKNLFPFGTLHAIAIKANPLLRILEFLRQLGMGAEAASLGEVTLALEAGYDPHMVVFDSPVKTISDLEFAMKAGVHINIDNFSELQRIATLRERLHSESSFGIRINPQVGTGQIAGSSVAGIYSKFGIPITSGRRELLGAFHQYKWLTGLHLHVGSQGCPMELLLAGISRVYQLMEEVNTMSGSQRIRMFDIGGGMPAIYRHSDPGFSMESYLSAIQERFPGLFNLQATSFPPSIITEFGRWVHAGAGWVACRVEYVKSDPPQNTVMIHAGADLFLRECLNPTDWHHEYTLLDYSGRIKYSTIKNDHPQDDLDSTNYNKMMEESSLPLISYNIAGPLCFSGDILARDIHFPKIEEGDYIVIHDAGGYTFSMWSRYNSRQTPRIIGYKNNGQQFEFLKERESVQQLSGFWHS